MTKVAITGNASGSGVLTIAAPNTNSDRTLTLPDNTGTVITTASTGGVAQAMLETLVVPLGVGQTWQNVVGSRASGTTYTNTTGRPIAALITSGQAGTTNGTFEINGTQVSAFSIPGVSSTMDHTYIIPTGATYRFTGNGGIQYWFELR